MLRASKTHGAAVTTEKATGHHVREPQCDHHNQADQLQHQGALRPTLSHGERWGMATSAQSHKHTPKEPLFFHSKPSFGMDCGPMFDTFATVAIKIPWKCRLSLGFFMNHTMFIPSLQSLALTQGVIALPCTSPQTLVPKQ